jgi:hypothetical protein
MEREAISIAISKINDNKNSTQIFTDFHQTVFCLALIAVKILFLLLEVLENNIKKIETNSRK